MSFPYPMINAIAEHANLTKTDANRALDGLLKTIETTLGLYAQTAEISDRL